MVAGRNTDSVPAIHRACERAAAAGGARGAHHRRGRADARRRGRAAVWTRLVTGRQVARGRRQAGQGGCGRPLLVLQTRREQAAADFTDGPLYRGLPSTVLSRRAVPRVRSCAYSHPLPTFTCWISSSGASRGLHGPRNWSLVRRTGCRTAAASFTRQPSLPGWARAPVEGVARRKPAAAARRWLSTIALTSR